VILSLPSPNARSSSMRNCVRISSKSPQSDTIAAHRHLGIPYNFLCLVSHKNISSRLRTAPTVSCHCLHGHALASVSRPIVMLRLGITLSSRLVHRHHFLCMNPMTHVPAAEDSTVSPSASPSRLFNKRDLHRLPGLHYAQTGTISILRHVSPPRCLRSSRCTLTGAISPHADADSNLSINMHPPSPP
jgi:hypothetical protein